MNYYFYSKQKGLIGLISYRLIQNSLFQDKNELIEELKTNGETNGFIYTCRQKNGQYFNNAYKTPHPIEIIGCENLEDLI